MSKTNPASPSPETIPSSPCWGIAIAAIGLALTIGLYPIGFWADPGGHLPLRFGPWMLGGLLPMFFGLGLVLIYVVTREEKKVEGNEAEKQTKTGE